MMTHTSRLLAGNPLGDPNERQFPVYLPPHYDATSTRRWPVVFLLAGYSGHGRLMIAERSFAERIDQRLDRLIATGRLKEAVFVMPDAFTRLGGSQYVDSQGTGPYESYITKELVPFIDHEFRIDPDRRGVAGKSSGGYGALRLSVYHPDVFHMAAVLSGDAGWEHCYYPDLADLVCALDPYSGSVAAFLADFAQKTQRKISKRDFAAMSLIAMSACYSPDATADCGLALPVHWPTGRLKDDVWARWLAFDPLRFLPHAAQLRRVGGVWVECGRADEYRLQIGARQMAEILAQRDVPCHYEEFDDGHTGLDWRLDGALPWLVDALAGL